MIKEWWGRRNWFAKFLIFGVIGYTLNLFSNYLHIGRFLNSLEYKLFDIFTGFVSESFFIMLISVSIVAVLDFLLYLLLFGLVGVGIEYIISKIKSEKVRKIIWWAILIFVVLFFFFRVPRLIHVSIS